MNKSRQIEQLAAATHRVATAPRTARTGFVRPIERNSQSQTPFTTPDSLQRIPIVSTTTYADIAKSIAIPKAVHAAAQACCI